MMGELGEIPTQFIDKGFIQNVFSMIIPTFWKKVGTVILYMKGGDKTE
jgi:hypothetical protein